MSGGRTSSAHSAITHDEADVAFAELVRFDGLLIAVSGGPDSLALLYLLSEWASRRLRIEPQRPAPRLFAATVDHRLRANSGVEAELVAEHCAKLAIPHATLVWDTPKPWSGLAEEARRARYRLLAQHAENNLPARAIAVVTAHTLDDQAETLVMRLQRGAGVEGLAAMPADRSIAPESAVRLVRPLLAVPKTRLIGTLLERGVLWCDDPTNDDATYERVRVRTTLRMLAERGVGAEALARTARRMKDASDALAFAEKLFRDGLNLDVQDGLCARLNRNAFDAGPRQLRQRVLANLIAAFGGAAPKAELSEIEALTERLRQNEDVGATLGGAIVKADANTVRVWREPGRIAARPVPLTRGTPVLWDDRFWVSVAQGAAHDGLTVSALGVAGLRALAAQGHPVAGLGTLPASVWHGVPAVWAGQTLLAVPVLGVLLPEAQSYGLSEVRSVPISAATLTR